MSKRLRKWRLSRARAAWIETRAAPELPAPDPELIEKFGKEAHDLDALQKSVADAAAVSVGFWLSYLFVLVYIGIAAGSVTHKDLLLESPVKLPFLNVELPLVAFFFLAPILFIISHAYALVHYVMLAAKAGVFHNELLKQLPDALPDALNTREGLRRQLPSNIFVQLCAGPLDIRKGGLGLLLKAVAWISLVIGPVILLLLIQAQFLPYHLEWVTWVQRFAVLVDLILLWRLWPAVLNGRSRLMWRLERRRKGWPGVLALTGRYIAGLSACLIPIGFAFTAATFPGEWLDKYVGKRQTIPPIRMTVKVGIKTAKFGIKHWTSFHDVLFNPLFKNEVDETSRGHSAHWSNPWRISPFSNTLVLPAFGTPEAARIDDPKKLDTVKHTLILRGRHLEGAIFDYADLRKADLEGAELQGAWLIGAQLQGAMLDGAQLQGASLFYAQLRGASLGGTQLQGAEFNRAHIEGASLDGAQLQGGDFRESTLAGTGMIGAAVRRANFDHASLAAVFEDGLYKNAISRDEFAALQAMIIKKVPEGNNREDARKRIEKLNPGILGAEPIDQEILDKGRVDETTYKKSLAAQLKSLACSGDESAPFITRGLVWNGRIKDAGSQAPGVVNVILKPNCPVSAALTEADKAALKTIAKEASGAH